MEYKIRKSLIEEKRDGERSDKLFYLGTATFFAILLCVIVFLNTYVFACVVVKGKSMESTLFEEDVLFINMRDEIDYGDIVVINEDGADYVDSTKKTKTEDDAGYVDSTKKKEPPTITVKIIKRVIAKGGDTVRFYNGYVYLKKSGEEVFTKLDEPYVNEQGVSNYSSPSSPVPEKEETEVEVPEGEIFFLGDNRKNSSDARYYGTRSENQVWGVVTGWSMKARPIMKFLSRIFRFGDDAH